MLPRFGAPVRSNGELGSRHSGERGSVDGRGASSSHGWRNCARETARVFGVAPCFGLLDLHGLFDPVAPAPTSRLSRPAPVTLETFVADGASGQSGS